MKLLLPAVLVLVTGCEAARSVPPADLQRTGTVHVRIADLDTLIQKIDRLEARLDSTVKLAVSPTLASQLAETDTKVRAQLDVLTKDHDAANAYQKCDQETAALIHSYEAKIKATYGAELYDDEQDKIPKNVRTQFREYQRALYKKCEAIRPAHVPASC